MEISAVPVLSALWLGIMTSVSPCPLASNIAALSFVVKRVDRVTVVLLTGGAYILGRVIAYCVLGVLLSLSLLNVPLPPGWYPI